MFKHRLGTIRVRLLLGFVLTALLPVLSATIGSVAVGVHSGRQQARQRLGSVAVSKEMAVRGWLGELQQQLVIVSATDCSYERIWVVVSLARDHKYLDFYNKAVRNRLQAFVGQSPVLEELFLIDASGRVVLSTDLSQEGRDVAGEAYFQQGLKGPFSVLPFDSDATDGARQEPSAVTVAMPIVGGGGQAIGVIAGRSRVGALHGLLHEGTGLGQSGKAYLVSADQAPLTSALPAAEPRTGGQAAPWEATAGVTAALSGRSHGTAIYDDHRGERVIGVFRWLPEVQAMLFVEQDQSEAFEATLTTLGINLIVALTALLLAVVLSLIIMRGIAKPIEDLAETATQIAAGDLERHARVERQDEIGQLAQAFNSMTTQLRELIAGLERRVAERTRELQRLALQMGTSAQVSREVTSILTIDTLLAKVTELIESAFGYYAVHIYLLDREANQLVFRASSSSRSPHDLILDIHASSLNAEAVRTNQELVDNDVSQDPRFRPDPNSPDIRSELVIPLRIGNRIIGTLHLLSSEPGSFTAEDVLVAQSLGDQIAIAIENARLYERSRELAVLEERNRLARELHDAMNQSLYSIVLFAGAAHKEAEKAGQDSIRRYLTRVESMAQQALKEMRLMLYELRPQELEQRGLVGALQQRLEAVEGLAGVDVKLQINGEIDLPPPMEETLYRIVQEALNNALKHAAATSVTVSIASQDSQVEVKVIDDGVGFDPSEPTHTAGMGVASMCDRAHELGATLQIESAREEGTSVILRIAMPAGSELPAWQEGER
jgi:nitrate/nitrite-specific signal transduction histidine kinase